MHHLICTECGCVQAFLDVLSPGQQLMKVQPKQASSLQRACLPYCEDRVLGARTLWPVAPHACSTNWSLLGWFRHGRSHSWCLVQCTRVTLDLHTCPARLPCRAVQHTYLACGLIARGSVAPSDLTRGIGRLRQQMRMAPWAEEAFKTGLCSCPPVGELRREPVGRKLGAVGWHACSTGVHHATLTFHAVAIVQAPPSRCSAWPTTAGWRPRWAACSSALSSCTAAACVSSREGRRGSWATSFRAACLGCVELCALRLLSAPAPAPQLHPDALHPEPLVSPAADVHHYTTHLDAAELEEAAAAVGWLADSYRQLDDASRPPDLARLRPQEFGRSGAGQLNLGSR